MDKVLTEKEENVVKCLRSPIVRLDKSIKTRSEQLAELSNEELLSLYNKMDSYIVEEGEFRTSLGSYDEFYVLELSSVKEQLNKEYTKRNSSTN